jgi:hypothetical protein
MLDLAISINTDKNGATVIETNRGVELKATRWPQDYDFQLVAFSPGGKTCRVIWTEQLSEDIRNALTALNQTGGIRGKKPDWYRRLSCYGSGI